MIKLVLKIGYLLRNDLVKKRAKEEVMVEAQYCLRYAFPCTY